MKLIPENNTVKAFFDSICHFIDPEQLWGIDIGNNHDEQNNYIKKAFRELIQKYHPDRYPRFSANNYYAEEIARILNRLRDYASEKIAAGIYGRICNDLVNGEYSSVIETPLNRYYINDLIIDGELTEIYSAEFVDVNNPLSPRRKAVVKLIKDPVNSYLINNEIEFYNTMAHFSIPQYIDDFIYERGRRGIILEYIDGYDLITLKTKFPHGIDLRHAVWIMDRLLSIIGLIHFNHILHCGIRPGNVIVNPKTHNCYLIDYKYAVISPDEDSLIHRTRSSFEAPELQSDYDVHPALDLYSLGKTFVYMLGGNVKTGEVPASIHPCIKNFITSVIVSNPEKRAEDAWEMNQALSDIRMELYNTRHEFLELKF